MAYSSVLDSIIMGMLLLLSFDALRKVTFYNEPLQTIAFLLLCIGSAESIEMRISGLAIPWWAISTHAGITLYALRLFNATGKLSVRMAVYRKGPAPTRRITD